MVPVGDRKGVGGQGLEDVLAGVSVPLAEREPQVPDVSAEYLQPVVVPRGPRPPDLLYPAHEPKGDI